jgi:hypothetical protein
MVVMVVQDQTQQAVMAQTVVPDQQGLLVPMVLMVARFSLVFHLLPEALVVLVLLVVLEVQVVMVATALLVVPQTMFL